MNKKPLISIIVPVYNAERYLAKCISSLLNQTLQNIEIICVNDGSTDNSLSILKGYDNNKIVIVDKNNCGVSDARNSGLNVARGNYIMFVDSDDWIEAETCEMAYDSIVREQADIVMWSYITETFERSTPKTIFPQNSIFFKQQVDEKLHRRFIGVVKEELAHPELADALCPVWGKLYKREVIDKANVRFVDLKEIGTYEDGLFNLEVFRYANKVVYLRDCFYHYMRASSGSVTSGYRKELFFQWKNLFNRLQMYINTNNLPEIYNEALSNRIALSILGLGLNVLQSDKNIFNKRREVKDILVDRQYRTACKKLQFEYFPIHWRIFYRAAKYGSSEIIYLLLLIVNKIIQ